MRRINKIYSLSICLLFFIQIAGAQNVTSQLIQQDVLTGSSSLSATNNLILDVRKISIANPLREQVVSAQLFIQLDLGEDYVAIIGAEYSFDLEYKIIMLDNTGQQLSSGEIVTGVLTIDQEHIERMQVIDFMTKLNSNTTFEKIALVTLNLTTGPFSIASSANFIQNNLRLSVESRVEYIVDVRDQSTQTMVNSPIIIPKNTGILGNRVQDFSWNCGSYEFPNYELQILRLYNTEKLYEEDEDKLKTVVDWTKALKIETQSSNKNFKLTIGEGSGFYLWRVRPIGNYFKGGIANSNNYGQWSNALATGEEVDLNKNAINPYEAFYFKDPDENLNWIYNRVFTEGNQQADGTRTSEGISYADGLLNARQNQVFNSAEDKLLISQTINDYSGRPSWSSLPVPITGDMSSGYQVGFVQDSSSGAVYTAIDFDDDARLYDPNKVKDSGTAFEYYSDTNNDLSIPDAEGYAFKRTLFKTDGTGRVSEASGVGSVHALGSQTDDQGRTTRILYGNPSDDELIRVFGEEAPLAETVTKTITIDPNNVASITYTSAIDGNVIATALATIKTDNLDSLSGAVIPFVISDTIENNFLQDRQFVSYKRLTLPYLADVNFSYELDCNNPGWGCLGGDCEYAVQFTITNLTEQISYESNLVSVSCGSNILGAMTWTAITPNAPALIYSGTQVTLGAGEYLMTKSLRDKIPINFVNAASDEAFGETQELIDAIAALMQAVDNDEDYQIFSDNMVLLKAYIDNNQTADVIAMLGLPADFVIPTGFDFEFDPTANSNAPAQLSFETKCCGASSIGITKPEICLACVYIDTLKSIYPIGIPDTEFANIQDTITKYFIGGVLDAHLTDVGLPLAYFDTIAPGFTRKSMAFMLTQMLTSQYYTGNSIDTLGNWYKAEHDQYGDLVAASPLTLVIDNNKYNYDCEKLFDCWSTVVGMIGNFQGGDETNIMDEFNGRQGDEESEKHYDDDEAVDKSSLGDKVLSFVISRKMRKFNNSDEGIVQPSRVASIISLPSLFMDCAGYQFAAIIDTAANSIIVDNSYHLATSPIILPNPFALSHINDLYNASNDNNLFDSDHGKYAPLIFDFDAGAFAEPYQLQYPYMLRPEWMFKYFVYNVTEDNYIADVGSAVDDYDHLLPDHLEIEINSCYNPPNCTFDDGEDHSEHELCFRPCHYYHKSWNSDQRLNFYNQIKYAPVDPDIRLTLDSIFVDASGNDDLPVCLEESELIQNANEQLEEIKNGLASRAQIFRSRIIQMFENNCYQLVDCQPGTGEYSMQEVNLMVQAIIVEIKNKLESLVYDNVRVIGVDTFPHCEEIKCHWVNSHNECEEKTVLNTVYFSPCDQLILDQIQYWDFLPYGITSQCNPLTADPNLQGNQYDGQSCAVKKDYSETYNVTNASLSSGNE